MVAGVAVLVLLSSVPLFRIVPVNFTPQDDTSEFEVTMRAPEGTSLEATDVLANRVATAIRAIPEVSYTMVDRGRRRRRHAQQRVSVFVKLKDLDERDRSVFEVVRAGAQRRCLPQTRADGSAHVGGRHRRHRRRPRRRRTRRHPVRDAGARPGQAADARASGWSTLTRGIPGLVDVDTNLNVGKPEMAVRIDRPKAADLGVQVSDAAEALRLLVGGDQVTTYNEGGEQYQVHVRALDARSHAPSRPWRCCRCRRRRLGSVTLDNIATFAADSAPTEIRRLNRQRQVTVGANMQPGTSQADAQQAHARGVDGARSRSGVPLGFSGRSRELNRTATAFLSALVLSLVFMYLVLAAQFESWLHPVTILLSLPLTLPFALLSLVIFGQSLNIFSALGMLVLFGVVKKNSILQIDHANQLRDEPA